MIPKEIKFKSLMNPGIVIFNDITYVVPGWHAVPTGTTLEEVNEHWEKETFENEEKEIFTGDYEKIVISTRTGEEYTVKFNGRYWSCTCIGFSCRGKCKHVEQAKIESKYETTL